MTVTKGSRWLTVLSDRAASSVGAVAAAGALSLALTACGGSSHPPAASVTTSATVTSPGSSNPGSAVTTGPVHAQLTGQTHTPVAKKNWTYTVTASDAHGRPLTGSVETEFAFQGTVVGKEVPPTHPLKHGRMTDVLQFPAEAVGNGIELQAVVHTPQGSVTLHWPVTVRK
jgi:hypothetical protein